MSLSHTDPSPGTRRTPFAFLQRRGRDVAPPPETRPPAPLSEADRALLAQAATIAAAPHWLQAASADRRVEGGVQLEDGEFVVWGIDRHTPQRPLAIALLVDGEVVLETFTEPASGLLRAASGCQLADHGTLELALDGHRFHAPGFADLRPFPAAGAREARELLERQRRAWSGHALRRAVQSDITGTLDRLARDHSEGAEPAAEGVPSAFLRHLAATTQSPIRGAGGLALANWIVSDVFEDPLRREIFCLDPATEALLNAPAFNTQLLRADVSVALLCFWRRHYQSLDLFSDDGLRRLQFKFVTAPFIRLKTNDRLVTPAIRDRLSAPSGLNGANQLPWSWYWVCLHEDQGRAERLADPEHLLALSFREVVADALDPGRLSFNPASWAAWWGGWGFGDNPGASRFDLALIALLEPERPAAALFAEQGAAHWHARLDEAFYADMPGLAALSLLCPAALGLAPEPPPPCDLAIIGHTNGTGLARNMAMFVDALAPCHPLVFDARTGHCVNDPAADPAGLRARVVLLCVNADQAPLLIARFAALCAEAHVIGFFLWETDHPPPHHRLGAGMVDEIWTPSHFVAEAYRKMTDVPVAYVGKGLRPPQPARWQRAARRFRRDGAFTFLFVCDFGSSIIRKNPMAAVRAFRAAFDADNRNVRLVIKIREIIPAHWSNIDGYWEELEALAAADPRIEFLLGDLSDDEYWALLGACDALVSLHRGEGFCYPVADAMQLGRPVIVTDYSGTRDFCTEQTAFPVAADIVPTPPAHMRSNGPAGNWALPRHDAAVAAMRQALTQRGEAATRAAAGRDLVASRFDFIAWRAQLLERLAPHLAPHLAIGAAGRLTFSSLAPSWPAAAGHAD